MIILGAMRGKLENISSKKGNTYVLKNINWQINAGEHWAVIGDNGSGKTTMLSILAAYSDYTDGAVYLQGEKVHPDNAIDLRRQIGFASSSYFARCYNKENGLNIVLGGLSGQLIENDTIDDSDILRAKLLLKSLGIGEKGLYPFDLLSKGQQQKVLLARALLNRSNFLLLDEACGGLDVCSKEMVLNTLAQYATYSNNATVYVTHHFDELRHFFTHVLILRKGQIFKLGEIDKVLTTDVLSEYYQTKVKVDKTINGYNIAINTGKSIESTLWQKGGAR